MALWLIANTAGRAAAQIVATDTADAATSPQGAVNSVRGGPRHLKWTSDSATAARRIAYVEKGGTLTADFCCVVDARAHLGETLKVISFSAYPGTETELSSETISTDNLVGIGRQDYVFPFSSKLTGQDGFAVEFSATDYEKTARQIFFGEGLEFSQSPGGSEIIVSPLPIHQEAFIFEGQPFHLYAQATVVVSDVSRELLHDYMQLRDRHREPMFLYDDTGTALIGQALEHKLWHVIIVEDSITPIDNDEHQIEWTLGILRPW